VTRWSAGLGTTRAAQRRQGREERGQGQGAGGVVANAVDLSAIASVGSAIALFVFLLVALAGYRRRADTGANGAITLAAIGVTALVLIFFAVETARNEPTTFVAILGIAVLSVVLDFLWKRGRPAASSAPSGGSKQSEVTSSG
jgi:hypothetical protein